MVIILAQIRRDIRAWNAIGEDIVSSLKVKGLLNLRVRRDKQMQQNQAGKKERQERIWIFVSV